MRGMDRRTYELELVSTTCSALSMVEREAREAQAGGSGGVMAVLGSHEMSVSLRGVILFK